MTVIVAGGGIAGMTMALTCHELGIPVVVHESVDHLRPQGVGINLQPNAVRELFDLGLEKQLEDIGVPAQEWALVGRNGNDVWAEPRGREGVPMAPILNSPGTLADVAVPRGHKTFGVFSGDNRQPTSGISLR